MSRLVRLVVLSLLAGLLPVLGLIAVGPSASGATPTVTSASARHAPARAAAVPGGTGGLFVPAVGRLVDTQAENYQPTALKNWVAYTPGGKAGVPTSGVAAVQITVSVATSVGPGGMYVRPGGSTSGGSQVVAFKSTSGDQYLSNTAIVPLGANGKIEARFDGAAGGSNTRYVIDIQGYFTAGQTAAGGYVPMLAPSRILDTRLSGQQLPQAQLAAGSTSTIQAIPADAIAIFANLTVVNPSNDGYMTPFPADLPKPNTRFNYEAGGATAFGTTIGLSATGQFKLYTTHNLDLVVDVLGYYTKPIEVEGASAFTPATAWLGNVTVPAGQTSTVTFAGGSTGVPAVGAGIDSVAANIRVNPTSGGAGYVSVWPDGSPDPGTSTVNYGTGIQMGFTTVRVGPSGGVQIKNAGNVSVNVVLSAQGWYSSPDAVVAGGQSITSRAVTLRASNVGAATGRPWVTYQYRTIGTSPSEPISVPPGDVTDGNDLHPNQTATNEDGNWPVQAVGSSFASYTWDVRKTLEEVEPSVTAKTVQVRACYRSSATDPNPLCGAYWTVEYAAGQYAYTAATVQLGPGTLSLSTGNFQLDAADASITTALGSMSIGRTLRTLEPNKASDTPSARAFGPGWVADLAGPDAGAGSLYVDASDAPGVLRFETPDGAVLVYQATSPTNTYPISYTGSGDTAGDGVIVTRTTASEITMVDTAGTKTTWELPAADPNAPPEAEAPDWRTKSVVEIGAVDATTYRYDKTGVDQKQRVTRIVAPRGKGISSCDDSIVDTTPGCRSLILTYGTPGGAAPDLVRLLSVTLSAPTTAGATNKTQIASFEYNTDARLIKAWNSQVTPALKTEYDYYPSGRLKTITPPGENAWTLVYDSKLRLSKLQRQVPVGNPVSGITDQTAATTIVYDVPRSGTGLPSLTAAATATWGQTTSRPVEGEATAIFPPSHEPAGTTESTVAAGDWKYATINYLGVNGRVTNTAVNGAGGNWLIDSTQYTPQGAAYWTLGADNRDAALTVPAGTDSYVAGRSTSAERADLLASLTVYDPLDPVKVTDTYGPTHPVQLPSGTTIHAREHTSTTYDEGAPHNNISPAGGPYRLPTTMKIAPYDVVAQADTGDVAAGAVGINRYGYAATSSMSGDIAGTKWPEAPNGADVPLNGWNLGQATTTTVQMTNTDTSSSDLVTTTSYDAEGRVVKESLPGDTGGTTPRTTNTLYYNPSAATGCTDPAYAGLVCRTESGASGGYPKTSYSYNQYGQVTTAVETFNAAGDKRTTTSTYDAAGRPMTTGVTTTGLPNTTAVPTVTYGYSTATGALTTQTTGSGGSQKMLTTSYDAVGQVRSYTDSTGAVTYYGYDKNSRIASVVDPKGATTMTYGIDSGAGEEHRALVTTKRAASAPVSTDTLGSSGSTDMSGNLDLAGVPGVLTFAGSYNTGGALVTQDLPGGLAATTTYDNTGTPTSLTYKKGTATWAAFNSTIGAFGRVAGMTNEVNGTTASTQDYTFDPAGRLTQVKDTLGTGGSAACTTRLYGFDNHSNRTTLTTRGPGAGGACATSGGTTVTSTYDAMDRITNQSNISGGTYTYDAAGRTLTVPGSDAQGTASHTTATGQLTARYHANDMVASLDQGTGDNQQTTSFGLDPAGDRIATQATTAAAVAPTLPVVTTVTNHYAGPGDSPSWSTSSDGTTTTWSRNVAGLGGLAVSVTGTGTTSNGTATVQLANLHGDIVASTPADGSAASVTGYAETTEYGVPRSPADAKTPYGWLGTHQRSSDLMSGLVLMGVRLYNPVTGLFLSNDPVRGGNPTSYTYPQDPIGGVDLDGEWCIAGWGNCSYEFHRKTGSVVHASNGIMDKLSGKHNVKNVNLVSWAIYHADFVSLLWLPTGSKVPYYSVYRETLRRVVCNIFGCKNTGDWVEFEIRINWLDSKKGHGKLNTMFCRNMTKCPDWVNRVLLP